MAQHADERYRFLDDHFAAFIPADRTSVDQRELGAIVAKRYAHEAQEKFMTADRGMRVTRLWFWTGLLLCVVGTGVMIWCAFQGLVPLYAGFVMAALPGAWLVVKSFFKREEVMAARKAGWSLSAQARHLAEGNAQVLQATAQDLIATGRIVAVESGRQGEPQAT